MITESLCRAMIMSARSSRPQIAPRPMPSISAGMKKFLKCSIGLFHGATYFERPTVGKKPNRVTTRNSRPARRRRRSASRCTANEPKLPALSNKPSRR